MEMNEGTKQVYVETAQALKGSVRRLFMARVVKGLGYFAPSGLTADFIVDCLEDFWRQVKASFPAVTTVLINLDNGPENHSRRTQFMGRLVSLADTVGLTLQLAYSPPYHSKYNPIVRVWGVLEQHWNGTLLDPPPNCSAPGLHPDLP